MALAADKSSIALQSTGNVTVALSLNGTSTPANYTIYSTTADGAAWLSVLPAGGGVPGSFKVSAAAKLDPGVYNGEIKVHSPGATNSPLVIPVTLTVTP
jgi:hypothetical protein